MSSYLDTQDQMHMDRQINAIQSALVELVDYESPEDGFNFASYTSSDNSHVWTGIDLEESTINDDELTFNITSKYEHYYNPTDKSDTEFTRCVTSGFSVIEGDGESITLYLQESLSFGWDECDNTTMAAKVYEVSKKLHNRACNIASLLCE
jgi:hypothetical protein